MIKRFCVVFLPIFAIAGLTLSAQGQNKCSKPPKTFDMAVATYSGETVRGCRTIMATNLNTIRYKYQFGSAITYQAAPDLSKALTASPVQAPSTPATPVQNPAAPHAAPHAAPPAAIHALKGKGPAKAAPNPFDSLTELIKQGGDARQAYTKTHDDFAAEVTSSYNGPISQLNIDTTTLQGMQTNVNANVALVAQATAALTSFLANSPNESTRLVDAMTGQLDAGSTFIQGVNAQFPSAAAIVALQTVLNQDVTTLNNAKAKLSGYSPGELIDLQAGLTSLTGVQTQLTAAFKTFSSRYKPTPEEQQSVTDETGALQSQINLAQADIARLKQLDTDLSTAITQGNAAVTAVNSLTPGATIYTNFVTAQTALISWKEKMDLAVSQWTYHVAHPNDPGHPNPFAMSVVETCDFAFSRTKDDAVTLTALDLTPGVANPTPQNVLSVTVECTSPLSIAAGVVFSTITDREFAIQANPNSTDSTNPNIIIQTNKSNFHPLPLALTNVRLWEPKEKYALYVSAGVAANIRSQSAGGSTAEYLIGPSLGLFRAVFITTGVYLGSQPSVGGGYYVGQQVPTSLTTVPIKTAYTAGFGLGISFTKP